MCVGELLAAGSVLLDSYQTQLRKIVDRLRVVLDELSELEKTRDDPALKQAALLAAMALAWIDLVDSLPTNNG